jgi:hypothetical protein
MKNEFFEKIKREGKISDEALQIIYNAKSAFICAPKVLNPSVRFPLFFIFRQFPRLCRILMQIKKQVFGYK